AQGVGDVGLGEAGALAGSAQVAGEEMLAFGIEIMHGRGRPLGHGLGSAAHRRRPRRRAGSRPSAPAALTTPASRAPAQAGAWSRSSAPGSPAARKEALPGCRARARAGS